VLREQVVIVPYADGPYLVRGPVVLRDQEGVGIDAGRRTIALCRCGKSRMRPFCDGTHRLIRFQAPSLPEDARSDRPRPSKPRKLDDSVACSPAAASLAPRLAEAAAAPPDSRCALLRSELRSVQRSLARLLESESGVPADGELFGLLAQVSALVALLESGSNGC
jgi:CDGSH-type Zn-finger protein